MTVSSLPEGGGLVVGQVVKNGPLDKAGGLEGDLWWKFDGQILVSRWQLVVLLRGKKAGDTVDVEFYREGKSRKISVQLEMWPERRTMARSQGEDTKSDHHLTKKLQSSKQTASLAANGEQLTLEKTDGGWRFEVVKDDKVLFNSELTLSDVSTSLESRWLEPFLILQMTLAEKMPVEPGMTKRRVRYISRQPE